MESLYLLLPMSVLLVLGLIGLFAWALHSDQFEDLSREGWRVLEDAESVAPMPTSAVQPELDSPGLDPAQVGLTEPTNNAQQVVEPRSSP